MTPIPPLHARRSRTRKLTASLLMIEQPVELMTSTIMPGCRRAAYGDLFDESIRHARDARCRGRNRRLPHREHQVGRVGGFSEAESSGCLSGQHVQYGVAGCPIGIAAPANIALHAAESPARATSQLQTHWKEDTSSPKRKSAPREPLRSMTSRGEDVGFARFMRNSPV